MRRPVRAIAAVAVVGLAIGAGALATGAGATTAGGSPTPSAATALPTVAVERRTLSERESVDGTLGYGATTAVRSQRPGTVTRLPAEGTVIERGRPLFEIDGRPAAILMYGGRPAWRSLDPRSSAGPDIRQLNENLRALGFDRRTGRVSSSWDARTTAAVKRWQRHRGVKATGRVELGDVVFLPEAVRVDTLRAAVGDSVGPGTTVFDATASRPVVSTELAAAHRGIVKPGDQVALDLPDGSSTTGHVRSVGAVAHVKSNDQAAPGSSSKATVTVVVVPDDPAATGLFDAAPVTVRITSRAHPDVLAVPVTALVALKGGGYAVERVASDGTRGYVPVDLGVFADGFVEVTPTGAGSGPALAPGDLVVVAE